MTKKSIHLLPEVKCNSYFYIIVHTGNYSIAVKRGHWPASKDISLLYLTFVHCCWMLFQLIVLHTEQ